MFVDISDRLHRQLRNKMCLLIKFPNCCLKHRCMQKINMELAPPLIYSLLFWCFPVFLSSLRLPCCVQAAVRSGSGPAESCSSQFSSCSATAAAPTADQPASTAIPGSEAEVDKSAQYCIASALNTCLLWLCADTFIYSVFVERLRACYLLLPGLCLYRILVLCGKCRTRPLRLPAHQTSNQLFRAVSFYLYTFCSLCFTHEQRSTVADVIHRMLSLSQQRGTAAACGIYP